MVSLELGMWLTWGRERSRREGKEREKRRKGKRREYKGLGHTGGLIPGSVYSSHFWQHVGDFLQC